MRSCFLSSFVELHSAVSEEKSKMSQPIRGQGSHLVFPIGPTNTNFVEDVEILFPVKFRWIPFSNFWRKVGAVVAEWLSSWLAEQEERGSIPGLATWIFRDLLSPASKSRYGWKIAKSTLILKTTNQPTNQPEEKSKMSQPIRDQVAHLVFPIGPKNSNLVEGVEILLPVKFC